MKYLIDRTSSGRKSGKVDMTRGYIIDDIGFSIDLVSRAMGLPTTSHLETWMVCFIETINTCKIPINWAMILNVNLDKKLILVSQISYDLLYSVSFGSKTHSFSEIV